jgi:hypothetical protein
MNRTLKRPMFRIGGSAGTGITSGLDQPQKMANGGRTGYQQGSMPSFQATGLPGFATQFGLNLLATPPQGNIFQTAAVAARDPFNRLQASQIAEASTASDRAFKEKLLERQIASDEAIAEMKQKEQFFAAQTDEEQFRERVKIYSESNIPIIKNNATDLANFEVKNKDQNYVQLDFSYNKKTKEFEPDFRSIPEGAITYNPKDGFAYKNENGQFKKLNPFTLKPLDDVDGTE